ncbi:MAG: hypothetical protein COA86_12405 [Kangiella sp.]|nr:MAG: hypothetical protein COA86_12405 [Kangiella sp.]
MKLKIKYKLFIAMLLANVLVIGGLYFFFSLSFNSSFKEYLDAHQEQKLSALVLALEERYTEDGSWDWLDSPDHIEWRKILERNLLRSMGLGLGDRPVSKSIHKSNPKSNPQLEKHSDQHPEDRRPKDRSSPPQNERRTSPNQQEFRPPIHPRDDARPARPNRVERRPPHGPRLANQRPFDIDPFIFLLNRDKRVIIGPPDANKQKVNWLDLKSNNEIVGYLGYRRTDEVTSDLDQLFIDKLKGNLSWSFLLVVFVSALVTVELARRFVKPIIKLRKATKLIASGDYSTQLDVKSKDEFGDLSKDFNRLSQTLKNNLSARQQWIADISHELRTPVAILRAELEAVQDGIRPLSMDTVESLHQEILRLTRLINDLHELSLSDSGALAYQFKEVEISSLIEDVISKEQPLINQSHFSTKLMNASVVKNSRVFADADRLIQLFANLLNNSLVYSDKGGKIEIAFKISDQQIIIEWKDSEPAVTDQQLEKLFERLYRVEGSRNRNSGGSGLGLSICKNIVEAHHGSISAQHSNLGGVQFTICLPVNNGK